jgi:hypothetical protein
MGPISTRSREFNTNDIFENPIIPSFSSMGTFMHSYVNFVNTRTTVNSNVATLYLLEMVQHLTYDIYVNPTWQNKPQLE